MTYNLVQKTHYMIPAPSAYPGMWEVYSSLPNWTGGPPEFKGRFPTADLAQAKVLSLNNSSAANASGQGKDSFD